MDSLQKTIIHRDTLLSIISTDNLCVYFTEVIVRCPRTCLEIPCYLLISWEAKCIIILDQLLRISSVRDFSLSLISYGLIFIKRPCFSIIKATLTIFFGPRNSECCLTHLEPTMRISDGQIPPNSMTHPWFYVELEGVLLVGLIESASLDSLVLVDSWVQ